MELILLVIACVTVMKIADADGQSAIIWFCATFALLRCVWPPSS